jgi:hypothetical protein
MHSQTDSKKLLMHDFTRVALQDELADTLGELEWCRQIRNQYAHCQWYWTASEGLCFVNLEHLAKQTGTITKLMDRRRPIDAKLLMRQVEYFNYVKESLTHLADAYKAWDRNRTAPRKPAYVFPKPPKIAKPPAHN